MRVMSDNAKSVPQTNLIRLSCKRGLYGVKTGSTSIYHIKGTKEFCDTKIHVNFFLSLKLPGEFNFGANGSTGK